MQKQETKKKKKSWKTKINEKKLALLISCFLFNRALKLYEEIIESGGAGARGTKTSVPSQNTKKKN